ncbi:MAG: hypothetical protein FVQ77_15230, partial [Cytophagales bacterium]|nr:hypothetical protein [Cytophagales bacterium]
MKKILLFIFLGFAFTLPRELKSQDNRQLHDPSVGGLESHHAEPSSALAAPKKFGNNLYSISEDRKYDKVLAKTFVPEEYWDHPDFGTLPYNAECENCIEEIHKRTEVDRFYIDANDPSVFYIEKSATPANYKVNGKWIAINANLKQVNKDLYAAYHQPFPTELNINEGWTSLKAGDHKLRFNQLVLIEYDRSSNITNYQANWSDYTIGDNGVHVYNIFPDIDMTIKFRKGGVKSNFIIKKRKTNVEKLIFRDNLDVPTNLTLSFKKGIEEEEKGWKGEIAINDEYNNQLFRYARINIRDDSKIKTHQWVGHYQLESHRIDVLVYSDLLDNDTLVYPLIVDPFVTYGPFAGAGLMGSRLTPLVCTQSLTVTYPGGSEPQDFSAAWEVDASTVLNCCENGFACWRCEAEVDITSDCGGKTPAGVQVWKCELDPPCDDPACTTPGLWTPATTFGSSGSASMISCKTPSCTDQSITFFFNLKRTYCSDAFGCDCNWATNGCNALNSWSVTLRGRTVEQNSPPTSSAGTTICQGTSTTLTANGSFGVPPYSYSWSPGGSCPTCQSTVVSPAVTTTYTATITSCGITATNNITITVLPNSTAPAGITATLNPICPGNSTTLTLFGGSLGAGATWNWYSGGCGVGPIGTGTSISVSPGSTTTYWVRASGTCNTTSCASVTITVNSLSTAPTSVSATVNPTCGGATTLSVVGGSLGTGATWNWYAGACSGGVIGTGTSIVVSPGSTTTYWVRASGPCNITTCASVTITVSSPSIAPTSVSATVNPTCGGATTLSIVGGSLGTGATWNWYAGACGGAVIGTGTLLVVSPGSTTTYFVRAVGTCNTTSCASVTITVNSSSTAPASISATSNPVCAGSSTTLSVVGGSLGTGASWNWYSSGCGAGPIGTGSSISVSPGSTTTYWVRASGTCNTTSCASVTITIITSSTAPSSAAASPNPTCGGATTLTLAGGSLGAGATWNWYSGGCGVGFIGTGSSISVSPASTTTYYVRAEGTCNTTGCASVTVTVNSSSTNPTGASATPNPVCAGSSVTLDVSGGSLGTGAAWNWYSGSCSGGFVATGDPIIVSPASTTTYFVKAVGTCNTTACVGVTVTVNPIPATPTPANNSPLCEGATLNLSTPFVSGGTYNWTGPNAFSSSVQNPIIPGVTTANAGVYSVTVTVSFCTSAVGNTSVTINPTPATPTPANNGPLCEGATLNLSTPFVPGGTYSWTGPNAFSSSAQNPTIAGVTSVNAGVYPVTVTVSGCISAANITTVTINTLPAIVSELSTDVTSCIVDDGTITITASGAAPPFQYSIDNGVTFAGSGTFTGLSAGNYPILISDANGCTVTGSTIIISAAGAPPSPAAGTDSTYCEGDLIADLTATGSNIVWFSDPGLTDSIGNGSPFSISPLVGTTTYYVTQTVSGCQSISNAVNIIVNATPATPAAGTDTTYCNGDSIADLTAAGSNIEWFFDAGLTIPIGANSPFAIFPGVGATVYYVTQTAGSCQGLADSVVIIVYAIPAAPTTGNDTTYCDGDSIANITAAGANIEWFSDPGLTLTIGSGSPFTPSPVVGINTFYAT